MRIHPPFECCVLLPRSLLLFLSASSPFPANPPRYIRAVLYEYHFTDFATRRKEGAWWRRERKGLYFPAASLRDQ